MLSVLVLYHINFVTAAETTQDELLGNQSMSTEMLTSTPIIKQEIIMDESTDNIESIMEGINSSSQEISEVSMASSFLDDVSEFPHIKSEQNMYGSPNVRRKFQKKGKNFRFLVSFFCLRAECKF